MSNYVTMETAFKDKTTEWIYTSLDGMSFEEIARMGIVLWCAENLEGRWTMLGGNKFGFENGGDALAFKLMCGI